MSDNPKVTDKYPLLVIPGYIYSAKGEPLTVAPVGVPSLCQLSSSPACKIDPHTQEAVIIYCVFSFSIGLMMILNAKNINSYNHRSALLEGVWQM
jgi:hypothetical protein